MREAGPREAERLAAVRTDGVDFTQRVSARMRVLDERVRSGAGTREGLDVIATGFELGGRRDRRSAFAVSLSS